MSTLQVTELTAGFGPVTALREVSLAVEPGAITAVLGANGAGKTTLLRTISGLVAPTGGSIRLDGADVTRAPVESLVAAGIAHVPEGRGVIAELTVSENLRLGALGGARRDAGESEMTGVEDVYEMFPVLRERRGEQAHVLSGGERQMLVIGRALLARPTLLMLDEPSLGLAPKVVASIFGLIRRTVERTGLAVLLVEQNARSALSIADVGVVLNLGAVVATDSARALLADDELRRAYLGF